MVWGRASAAHKAPEVDLAELPVTQKAQCARCELWTTMPNGDLPPGWVAMEGAAYCHDCIKHVARSGHATNAKPPQERKLFPIGAIASRSSKYGGCRIGHEFAADFVGLTIHGGAKAPDGRDERIHFMMARSGLDELIAHLRLIRAGFRKGAHHG